MKTLNEVLAEHFLDSSEWVKHAILGLGDHEDLESNVADVGLGWLRRGGEETGKLIDTVFVLTSSQLGIGQTSPGIGDPRWIPLSAVEGVDAVDGTPYPLQTIEITLTGGMVMCVGWNDNFVGQVISVLTGGETSPSVAAQQVVNRARQDVLPPELVDPSLIAPDASGLGDISAAAFVEPNVVDEFFANAPDPDDAPASEAFVDGSHIVENEPAETTVDTTLADEPMIEETGEPTLDNYFHGTSFESQAGYDQRVDDFFDPEVIHFSEPSAGTSDDSPWLQPGIKWPEPIKPVTYLRGLPALGKKRKGGIMVISKAGITATGTTVGRWDVFIEWTEIENLEIYTPDEVRFTENLKIDPKSCVLAVELRHGTSVLFELRSAPAATTKTKLGAVLAMAHQLKTYHFHNS